MSLPSCPLPFSSSNAARPPTDDRSVNHRPDAGDVPLELSAHAIHIEDGNADAGIGRGKGIPFVEQIQIHTTPRGNPDDQLSPVPFGGSGDAGHFM
jgi:hypothetical protein